jgi:predicted transcriptional regulator
MSRPLNVRLPNGLMDKLETIEQKEDKSKTHVVITLLEEAIKLREFRAGETEADDAEKLRELQLKCTTEKIMEMHHAIAELVRYTYVKDESKFKDQCSSSREVLASIKGNVETYIDGVLQK